MKKPGLLLALCAVVSSWVFGQAIIHPVEPLAEAQLIVAVEGHSAREADPAWRIRKSLLAEYGLSGPMERFEILVDPKPTEVESYAFQGFLENDQPRIVGVARGEFRDSTRRSLELSQELTREREFRVHADQNGDAFFGDKTALERLLEASSNSNATGTLHEAMSTVPDGAVAWAAYGGDWLAQKAKAADPGPRGLGVWSLRQALSAVSWASISIAGRETVYLKTVTQAGSIDTARLLEDELQTYFASARRMRGSEELKKSFQDARVEGDDTRISLTLELDEKAVEQLAEGSRIGALLRWDLQDNEREDWQRIGEIFEHLTLDKGSRVADIGAGSGFLTFRLARAVGETGRVWAVDIDKDSLATLRERAGRAGYGQIEVVEGKADSPGLPKDSLEGVVIVNAYHEMVKHRKMLRQIRRALVSGGRLVLIEPFDPDRRNDSREDQVRRHDIAPEIVEKEVRQAGFEIVTRDDDFVLKPLRESLVVARKP